MKAGINLPDEKITAIKEQIEKHVKKNEAAKKKQSQKRRAAVASSKDGSRVGGK